MDESPTNESRVFEQVEALLPKFRDRAVDAEETCRLPDETIQELKSTGFGRLLQPKRFGGYEAHPRTFYENVLAIGAADGSTGWVSGVVGVHPWQIAHWPIETQEEVWGDDPDTWVSSSYMPGGTLTPEGDGYRFNGRWSFSSGSDHCDWVIVGCTVVHDDEGTPPQHVNALVRKGDDYRIEHTWDTVGLRGTGSNDIVVEDVFLPARRVLDLGELMSWRSPGLEHHDAPLFRMPFASMFSYAVTAPLIGMAQSMVDENIEHTKTRVSNVWGKATTDPYTVSAVGRAASTVEACRLQLFANMDDMFDTVERGEEITIEQRSKARRDQVMGTLRSIEAIDDVYDRAGAGAIMKAAPMQRTWRDAHAARHHVANNIERALANWSNVTFGLPPTEVLL